MKLLQFSDLHLSASNDPDYGLNVLREIVAQAISYECKAMLLCGDIFDTYKDLDLLRAKVVQILGEFNGSVYFLPGNHESLRKPNGASRFNIFDWGNQIQFLEDLPYTIVPIDPTVELLAIPHRNSYADLITSLPPKKNAAIRIGLAHATIIGMSFTGIEDDETDEKGGLIDVSQLQALECDYVAVGHIHSRRAQLFGNMEVAYAGSSRVWRKGEFGDRCCYLLEISDGKLTRTDITLRSAGCYREVIVQLGLDGKPEKTPEEYLANFSENDWVRIQYHGVVESMEGKKEFQAVLESDWKSKFRILDFDELESEIKVVANLTENSFIKKFIQVMDDKKSSMNFEDWLKTKELGLMLLIDEVSK
ncbi:MAG: metallophosphoesterase [Leptospira sp.]|nr:metallophosphoesterase [Leptospira sp.]